MGKINNLKTKPSRRYSEFDPEQDSNKNTKFADLIIDDTSLYQMLKQYDLVPSLGWGSEENQRLLMDYFLMEKEHPSLYYRYPILICPWCGDEECGFISVFIERKGNIVIWQDFKLEPGNKSIPIGPFYFEWENYKKMINDTYKAAGTLDK